MAWDKEKADEVASEFKQDLADRLAVATAEEKAFFTWLQREWAGAYRTCGHKRLGRVIVAAELET